MLYLKNKKGGGFKMFIQELFKNASIDNMLNIIVEKYYKNRNYSDERLEKLKAGLRKAYDEMLSIKPVFDNNWLIVIDYTLDDLDTDDTNNLYLDTYLFDKKEILRSFKTDTIVENNIDVEPFDYDTMISYVRSRPLIMHWGYEFSSWTEVMGFSIWDDSISQYGLDTCAAAILYEATFSGFSQTEVEKRADEIFRRTDEKTEELTDDDIETDEDQTSTEDLKTKKTEEKMKNDFLKSLKIAHKNWISLYPKLKKIYIEEKTREG